MAVAIRISRVLLTTSEVVCNVSEKHWICLLRIAASVSVASGESFESVIAAEHHKALLLQCMSRVTVIQSRMQVVSVGPLPRSIGLPSAVVVGIQPPPCAFPAT